MPRSEVKLEQTPAGIPVSPRPFGHTTLGGRTAGSARPVGRPGEEEMFKEDSQ